MAVWTLNTLNELRGKRWRQVSTEGIFLSLLCVKMMKCCVLQVEMMVEVMFEGLYLTGSQAALVHCDVSGFRV